MTKNEIVRELAEDFSLPRKQVAEMMEALLEKMTNILKSGDKVQLTPFGQFKIRDRAARIARNPQTGEPVKVPAKRVLKFIAGKPLKDAVAAPRRGGAAKKSAPAKKKTAPAARKTAPAARKAAPAARKAAPAARKKAAPAARKKR
jgi:DNA-binding protein HU-beta